MARALWTSLPFPGDSSLAILAALVDLGAAPSPILHAAAEGEGYGELRFEAAGGVTRAELACEEGARSGVLALALAEAVRQLRDPEIATGQEPAWTGYVARGAGEDAQSGRRALAAMGEVTRT